MGAQGRRYALEQFGSAQGLIDRVGAALTSVGVSGTGSGAGQSSETRGGHANEKSSALSDRLGL